MWHKSINIVFFIINVLDIPKVSYYKAFLDRGFWILLFINDISIFSAQDHPDVDSGSQAEVNLLFLEVEILHEVTDKGLESYHAHILKLCASKYVDIRYM